MQASEGQHHGTAAAQGYRLSTEDLMENEAYEAYLDDRKDEVLSEDNEAKDDKQEESHIERHKEDLIYAANNVENQRINIIRDEHFARAYHLNQHRDDRTNPRTRGATMDRTGIIMGIPRRELQTDMVGDQSGARGTEGVQDTTGQGDPAHPEEFRIV
ncbi:hypothetical protein R1sor_020694 [Riccia sorocarpa]|uniref:Uncharacterized protein n=1 Tax=Riccia sorocarpa TaxID=122646 RepID=A0ABD3GFP2_9MARC